MKLNGATMKHALTFLTALLLAPVSTAVPAIIAAIGFAAAARAEPPNPGFEDAKDGVLKSWTLESKPIPGKDGVRNATNVRAVWDTGSRGGGQRCLRVQTDGQTGDEFGLAGSAPLKLLPGFEYDFSFHYKAEGLLPETGDRSKYAALICDIFCNDEKRRIGGDRIMTTVNSADWARLSKRDLVIDEVPAKSVAMVAREPKPDPTTRYAVNLLRNGEVEEGVDGKPVGWTHVGTPEPDWTQEAIARLHTHGRPDFSVGRSRGEWSRELTYSGQGALLNISVDPPNSPNHQWYGRNPVDGYWLSDPMPCEPGAAYLAAAWIKPGAVISEAWYGPLELFFYDKDGKKLAPKNHVRCGLDGLPPGVWSYWISMPWVAPDNAAGMRLRFGQELKADKGGWGRTFADNLAVWKLSETARIPTVQEVGGRSEAFRDWFLDAHAQVKPPYAPAPASAPEYEGCWGTVPSTTIGNLFRDPLAPVNIGLQVASLLGEARTVTLRVTRYDWLGNALEPVEVRNVALPGWGDARAVVSLPPSGRFGAFFLDVQVLEGDGGAVMGRFSGRYAVMPPLERPRTAENIWGVTPLVPVFGDGRPFEREMGEMMRVAGFGLAWVRLEASVSPDRLRQDLARIKPILVWYRSLGIRPVLQLMIEWRRPVERRLFEQAGAIIATECQGLVAAYGNHGIEQANSESPFRGGGKDRLTDDEFDTMLAGIHDGIKSVDKETPVLIGNIATDWECKTVRRLYGKPGEGKFDGAILNAYLGILMTAQNTLKEFNARGDTAKTVWQEETAEQRSPPAGDARRYGEADGPRNMVRMWLAMAGNLGKRLKAMTQWGLVTSGAGDSEGGDIFMLTANLQPRPHFVAHAVMADALADAALAGNRSIGDVSIFEWTRGDGPFFAAWASAGERTVTFNVPAGKLTQMDLMGNRSEIKAENGIATVKVTPTPIYLFGGGGITVSRAAR